MQKHAGWYPLKRLFCRVSVLVAGSDNAGHATSINIASAGHTPLRAGLSYFPGELKNVRRATVPPPGRLARVICQPWRLHNR